MNLFKATSTSTQDVCKIVDGYVFPKAKSSETKHCANPVRTGFKVLVKTVNKRIEREL